MVLARCSFDDESTGLLLPHAAPSSGLAAVQRISDTQALIRTATTHIASSSRAKQARCYNRGASRWREGRGMPQTRNRAVMMWILSFALLAGILVVFGGFVRLTRSGLSIVEWNPVQGTMPPLSEMAWRAEFAKYRLTPEYLQINKGMTLAAYREIFLIEWFHRLLARVAGLVFAIPFFFFVWTRRIPRRDLGIYIAMGVLFLFQAVMGWIMVSSGLVDRPSVSHYLLAAHLFLALSLIGLALWTALGHRYGFRGSRSSAPWSSASKAAVIAMLGLLVQMAYGAFTAGLKAGHVSDTWPLTLGRWIPSGLLNQMQPPFLNLIAAPLTVAFIHRWLAVLVLILAGFAVHAVGKSQMDTHDLRVPLQGLCASAVLQFGLGIAVVISRVNIIVALLHQANALAFFGLAIIALHRLRSRDASRGAV